MSAVDPYDDEHGSSRSEYSGPYNNATLMKPTSALSEAGTHLFAFLQLWKVRGPILPVFHWIRELMPRFVDQEAH